MVELAPGVGRAGFSSKLDGWFSKPALFATSGL